MYTLPNTRQVSKVELKIAPQVFIWGITAVGILDGYMFGKKKII